jgi:acetolactate synthase-1/2/3 large subunit
MMERAPVLVLTDRYGDAEFRRLPRQRLKHDQLFGPITKGTLKIAADNSATVMQRAVRLTMEGRPGPVHVDLPYDVMLAETGEAAAHPPPFVKQSSSAAMKNGSHDLAAAVNMIEAAQRPVLIGGLQVNRRGVGAEDAFAKVAQKLNCPVFTSLSAKGLLNEDHPMSAGTFRGVESERPLIDKADLIVLVGFDAVEIFTPGIWHYDQPILSIDEVPYAEGPYRIDLEVITNLEGGLEAVADSLAQGHGWDREEVETYKRSRAAGLNPDGPGLMPGAVIRLARQHLADDGFMAVDAGQHKVLTSDLWETRRRRGFLTSSGLGTMAVSVPAAIGAKLIEPESPSLALIGDGGFLMRVGDLETAVREQLPVVIVVFNDRTLNLVKLQQDRRGMDRLGTSFAETDFAAVARGFGFEATTVDDEDGLDAALTEAFASNRPWLIDARINPDGYL